MKKQIKSKKMLCFILATILILLGLPLSATTLPSNNNAAHEKMMLQYLDELKSLQNRTFYLSQIALDNPPIDKIALLSNISNINGELDALNKKVMSSLSAVPSISQENTELLLTLNAINLIKNSLYQLTKLSDTTANVDRILLLEEFFRLRIDAEETLDALTSAIENR